MGTFDDLVSRIINSQQARTSNDSLDKVGNFSLPKLAIVDIENLCNSSMPDKLEIYAAKKALDVIAEMDASRDQYVIGCSHKIQKDVEEVWTDSAAKNWELRVRSGKDGADLAIGSWVMSNLDKLKHFEALVIGSGDRFFAEKNFIERVYSSFDSSLILQIVYFWDTKSHKHDAYHHNVSYVKDVYPTSSSCNSLAEIEKACQRYSVLGRKPLRSVPMRAEPSQSRTVAKREAALVQLESEKKWHRKHLVKDGHRFEVEKWIRSFDSEYSDKVFLSDTTFRVFEGATLGSQIVIVDPDGRNAHYEVSIVA